MSNSSLANYVNRMSSSYGLRSNYIDKICVYSSGTAGDIYTLAELMASGSNSFHYGIDDDGTVGLFVDEMYSCGDDTAVNIIVMEDDGTGIRLQEGSREQSLVNLVEDIARRNYILKLQSGVNFFQSGGPGVSVEEVNHRLTSARMSSETEALKAQSAISLGALHPYIAIIDPSAKPEDFDCYALRNMGCVGALVFAGSLFDQYHNVTKPYKNPYLKAQMEKIIPARMHWALLATSRARTMLEAKEEIYWLFFVVAKYGPKLGVWLQPELDEVDGAMAEAIVELYYKYFLRWGLKDKCGLYCTKAQAEHVNWPAFVDRMSLWLDEPLDGLDCLENLLTPSLFKYS